MSHQLEENEIERLLGGYAQALNTADIEAVAGFFADDALFIPDSRDKLYRQAQIATAGNGYLKKSQFNITYSIENIVIDGVYAFVTSRAEVLEGIESTRTIKNSIDQFVLKKIDGRWKIYRYIFNNVRQK